MNREDVRKLLGGYATGTLTPAEQDALFAAALEDQDLFDALMKEEPLREVLEDPVHKAALLAALQPAAPRPAWWSWRPLIGALAMAGIALAVVAVWRANSVKPAPVIVAQVEKQPAPSEPMPAPNATAPVPVKPATTPPVAQPRQNVLMEPAASPAGRKRDLPERRDNGVVATGGQGGPPGAVRTEAFADQIAPAANKGEVQVSAAAPVVAPKAPAPPPPQQQGQAAPSPMAQQQVGVTAQALEIQASPALSRAAINGFRAADSAKAKEVSLDKKTGSALEWAILRGDTELPPGTVLNAGETIRLRIVSMVAGTLTVRDGEKILATSVVEASQPYDTPPIPFTVVGVRRFTLTIAAPPVQPSTLLVTLIYR